MWRKNWNVRPEGKFRFGRPIWIDGVVKNANEISIRNWWGKSMGRIKVEENFIGVKDSEWVVASITLCSRLSSYEYF